VQRTPATAKCGGGGEISTPGYRTRASVRDGGRTLFGNTSHNFGMCLSRLEYIEKRWYRMPRRRADAHTEYSFIEESNLRIPRSDGMHSKLDGSMCDCARTPIRYRVHACQRAPARAPRAARSRRLVHHTPSARGASRSLSASGPRPRASARRSAEVARVVGRDVMARVRGAHRAVWPQRGSGAGLRRLDVHRLDLARSRRTGWVGRGGEGRGAGGRGRGDRLESGGRHIVFVRLLL